MDCNNMNEFCKFICQYNDQISLIVNAVSSIAMVATVIVALCANGQANKQLKSALEMQEQSKNIELYEKRLEIIKTINQFDSKMCIEESQMLPIKIRILYSNDEKIIEKYKQLGTYYVKAAQAEDDEKRFISVSKISDGVGGFIDLSEKIEKFKQKLRTDYDESTEKSFRLWCKDNKVDIINPETNRLESVNYYDIYSRAEENKKAFFTTQKELIDLMEQFINKGLQPIT